MVYARLMCTTVPRSPVPPNRVFISGINNLTDRQSKNLKPGARRIKIGDGDKLWLFASPSGIKVWRMLWKEGNTQKQFTIGPYPTISLKEAREKRDAVHGLLVQGLDPNEQYRAEQKQQDEETPLTSRVVAQEWYAKRTVTQTENTRRLKMQRLERHVFPSFGDLPIKQLKPRDIILALHAIESQGHRKMTRRVGHARVVGYLEYGTGQTGQAARVHKERTQKGVWKFLT